MTGQAQEAAETWSNPDLVRRWAANDALSDFLQTPRAIATALVSADRPQARTVVDVASGPGAFLGVLLDALPEAHGWWTDASEAMRPLAESELARHRDRVTFELLDMIALAGSGLPRPVDVLVTARAAHHLSEGELRQFYREAVGMLAPGGWLVNLDHFAPEQVWNRRYRAVRPLFGRRAGGEVPHHHDRPLLGRDVQLEAVWSAGLTDADVAWQGLFTFMLVGRKDDPGGDE